MPNTTRAALPYPAGTDAANVPYVIQQALEALDQFHPISAADVTALDPAEHTGALVWDEATEGLYLSDGAAFARQDVTPWAAYTTTLAGMAVGTGGSAEKSTSWRLEHGLVHVRFKFVLGTSGQSVSGNPQMSLPVAAATLPVTFYTYTGAATYLDVSAGLSYHEVIVAAGTTDALVMVLGTNGVRSGTTSSVPFSWGAGDVVAGDFYYQPAT